MTDLSRRTIHYMGLSFSVLDYTGKLYRADTYVHIVQRPVPLDATPPRGNILEADPNNPTFAVSVYNGRNIKYFTTSEEIARNEYVPQGAPYLYSWETIPDMQLVLLDMFDTTTRNNVITIADNDIKKAAIRIAFPLNGDRVYRFSSQNTQSKNDISFRVVCTLPVDGFYVPETNINGKEFHPEIGLCHKAFHKIKVNKIKKFRVNVSSIKNSWRVGMHAVNAAPPAAALSIAFRNKAERNKAKLASRGKYLSAFPSFKNRFNNILSNNAPVNYGVASAAAASPVNYGAAVAAAASPVNYGAAVAAAASPVNYGAAATAAEPEQKMPPRIRRLSGSKRKRNNNNNSKNKNENNGLASPPSPKKRLTKKQRHL